MKDFFKARPFAKIGLLVIPLLLFTLAMEKYFPKNAPDGYESFIVAFEFANTPEQIHMLLNGLDSKTIRKINIGNYIDFGFMLTYSLFLFLFFKKGIGIFGKKWLAAGMVISGLILCADFAENLCLLKVTSIYSFNINDSELVPVLKLLHLFTWIKWLGLAIIFALYSIKLLGRKIVSNIGGIVLMSPILLSFWALTMDPMGISRFTLSIFLGFLILVFYSFSFKQGTKKAARFLTAI